MDNFDLQTEAFNELSNFNDEDNFSQVDQGMEKSYTVTVVNAAATPISFYVNASYKRQSAKGVMVAGVMAGIEDAGATTSLTVSGDAYDTPQGVRKYWELNPTTINRIQVSGSAAAVINNGFLRHENQNPYEQGAGGTIKFSSYKDPKNQDDKFIRVTQPIPVDSETDIIVTVPGSSTITLQMFVGSTARQKSALINATKNRRIGSRR